MADKEEPATYTATMDAQYLDGVEQTGSIPYVQGAKRYTSLAKMRADASANDFSSFTSDLWTIVNGVPVFTSAMESAEGMIQEKGYRATFPILVNIAETPSYFISLKDDAGLVKAYSFVSVSNYQIVGVADTLAGAQSEYIRLLKNSGKIDESTKVPDEQEFKTVTGTVEKISSAVVNGNSKYYIKISGNETIFVVDITLSDKLPLISSGDNITLKYYTDEQNNVIINEIN